MSSNNNDHSGALVGIAFVFAALWFMMIAVYAIACFLAVVLTILSFIAWYRPLKLGRLVIEPHEARQLVFCGILGAVGLPAFAVFCSVLFDLRIPDEWWFYIVTSGYAFGSIGLCLMLNEDETETIEPVDERTYLPAPPPARQLPAPTSAPFRYASWDDEEERGS